MTDKLLIESLKQLKECGELLHVISTMTVEQYRDQLGEISEAAGVMADLAEDIVSRAYRDHGIDCDPPDATSIER